MSEIEVFADIVCPFTHVSLRRLVDQRAQLQRHDVVIRMRAWPLELVNGEPVTSELATEEVGELRDQVAPDLFTGFDPTTWPSTSMPAFALVAAAAGRSAEDAERMSLSLRTELFERGRDISDPEVLTEVAVAQGIEPPDFTDERTARADWADGVRRGVQGSPHYFIGSYDFFCPSLEIEHVDGRLHINPDPEAFDQFLERALGR